MDELAELAHRFFELDQGVKEGLHIQNQDLARGEFSPDLLGGVGGD